MYKCSKFNSTILIWTCLLEYTLHDTHFVNGLIYLLYFFFIRQLIISNLFPFSDGHIGYSATGGNRKIRNWITSTWRKIDKNDKCLITSIERCKVRPVNLVNWLTLWCFKHFDDYSWSCIWPGIWCFSVCHVCPASICLLSLCHPFI